MDKLLANVSDITKVSKDKLSPETGRGDLEAWDSLTHLRLVSEIEEAFDISIPFEDISQIKKIADFMKYIKE